MTITNKITTRILSVDLERGLKEHLSIGERSVGHTIKGDDSLPLHQRLLGLYMAILGYYERAKFGDLTFEQYLSDYLWATRFDDDLHEYARSVFVMLPRPSPYLHPGMSMYVEQKHHECRSHGPECRHTTYREHNPCDRTPRELAKQAAAGIYFRDGVVWCDVVPWQYCLDFNFESLIYGFQNAHLLLLSGNPYSFKCFREVYDHELYILFKFQKALRYDEWNKFVKQVCKSVTEFKKLHKDNIGQTGVQALWLKKKSYTSHW